MPQSDTNGHRLIPLEGELPSSGHTGVTVFLCCHGSDLERGLLPTLLRCNQDHVSNPVHCHVLDLDADGLALLNLTARACDTLHISVTREDVPAHYKESGPSLTVEFGLLRLQEIHLRVPGRYALVPLRDAAQISLQEIDDALSHDPVLIDQKEHNAIAVDENEPAQKSLSAIARPLLNRLQSGDLTAGDGGKVLETFKQQSTGRALVGCGDFPTADSRPPEPGDPLNKPSNSLAALKKQLWSEHTPAKTSRRVLLLTPEMALPFKSPALFANTSTLAAGSPLLKGSMGSLRKSWQTCFDHIEAALRRRGHAPLVLCRPGTELTPALANASGADVVIIPHRQSFQCPGLDVPALYLMQIAHRWLFTLDIKGWGAGAAAYPYDGFDQSPDDGQVYDTYQRLIGDTNDSKFEQPDRQSRASLVQSGDLPDGDYIFFPCQIPDDEVVRFFCDYTEEDVITALASWANANQVNIVFKAHPAAPATSKPFRDIATGPTIRWADASIHDLLEHCQAVYTLNSGVGHEAIFYGKPVVMFGRAEYDCLAIRGMLGQLDDAYNSVTVWEPQSALRRYKQFYHWFTQDMAIDLQASDTLNAALGRVVDHIEAL